MITYKNKYCVYVYLDKKHIGNIFAIFDKGWQYVPKGQKEGGEIFASLALCKKSLEE